MMTQGRDADRRSVLRDALLRIGELELELARLKGARYEPVAVIGMGCRFPGGAADAESFWRLLEDGVDAIGEVPADRWDLASFYDSDPAAPGKMYTRCGGFLRDVSGFDAEFFGVAPREAVKMDPQHRVLLEVAWEALEDAGISAVQIEGSRTGVFVGITGNDYLQRINRHTEGIDAYHMTGGCLNFATGRLSYLLGLQGPSLAVDTACSSSLVALHLACQSLRSGECRIAIAGGVNLILSPETFITASKARMLAPDGRCKTFDARADGFARGEGCGVVVLKRLSDARRDDDRILAVIRGTAVNQDGKSSGLTVPNRFAQEAVIREALACAGVEPAQVDYVEAHGTGTSLGDPIEVRALAAVLGNGRSKDRPFLLGSVKTNIGHLESAAGVAGLIKVILSLQHQTVPPHLHLRTPNPHVAWGEIPARIPTALTPWPITDHARIAGLSSFGGSGTNAHVVVEEAPAPIPGPSATPERPQHILVLSAKTRAALWSLAKRFGQYLEAHPEVAFPDVCYTTNTGRVHFAHRLALVAETTAAAEAALATVGAGGLAPAVLTGPVVAPTSQKIAFLFTGQGSQYVGMGRELYETQATFRHALDRCAELLRPHLEHPLLAVLFGATGTETLLDETGYTQPALFALEYGLAELWRSWGVEPTWVLGHSVGEIAAACVAGVVSLEDGLALIAARARLMQGLPKKGRMVAVWASAEQVQNTLDTYAGEVALAAVNGPASVVLSGEREAIARLVREFDGAGIKTKALSVSHAFHSPLMDPILVELERVTTHLRYAPPRVGLVSNLTGAPVRPGESDAGYWVRHARGTVQFHAGMRSLEAEGVTVFLEIGPHPVLLGLGRQCLPECRDAWLPSLRKGQSDWKSLLSSLGDLHVRGVPVDWAGFDRDYPRRKVSLPTYPFQRERYWVDDAQGTASAGTTARVMGTPIHPLLGVRISTAMKADLFEAILDNTTLPYLWQHRVRGHAVMPAAAYLEMALAALPASPAGGLCVGDMVFGEPLLLEDGVSRQIQSIVTYDGGGGPAVRIFSRAGDDEWRLHAEGRTLAGGEFAGGPRLTELQARCKETLAIDRHYASLANRGLEFGPAFRGVDSLFRGAGEALGRIRLCEGLKNLDYRFFHPALLDACLQVVAAALPETPGVQETYLPIGVDELHVRGGAPERVWSHARLRPAHGTETVAADLQLFDDEGTALAEVRGLRLKRAGTEVLRNMGAGEDERYYEIRFTPKPLPTSRAPRLPHPNLIAGRVVPLLEATADQSSLRAYAAIFPKIEAVSADYARLSLARLGWMWRKGERATRTELVERFGVSRTHGRLFGRLLEMLAEEGYLRRENQSWTVLRADPAPSEEELAGRVADLVRELPSCQAQLTLLERCGANLADVLRGECDALELLFPDGSLTLAEGLNQETPFSLFHNGLIRDAVGQLVHGLSGDRRLRVLEVGAGTGATTSFVLPRLPSDRTEYVFTDVSPLFVARAQERFGTYRFVRYGILDIEKDPIAQDLAPNSFDLVIAANVLHATRDLRETLAHVSRLLSPDGILILREATVPQRWIDLTFGLTEGWWRFADTARRPAYPLLGCGAWRALLAEVGYREVVLLPDTESGVGCDSQETVVLAVAPQRDVAAPEVARGRWLLFSDAGGVGRALADRLRAGGHAVTVVRSASETGPMAPDTWTLNPGRPLDFRRVLQVSAKGLPWHGVIHLWSLDTAREPESITALEREVAHCCGSILHLVQALAAEPGATHLRGLWLVTRGAQAADAVSPIMTMQSPVTGLARVIGLEHPEFHAVHVDLDPAGEGDEVDALAQEIFTGDGEDGIAVRGRERLVARVVRWTHERSRMVAPESVRLEIEEAGVLDRLAVRPVPRRPPGSREVELRVRAAGLNFRDVLCALGMYPGEPGPLGVECVGEIVAVGDGVEEFRPGDEVMGLALGGFATFATTDARFLVRRPVNMLPEEAATIPSAFLTAWYALHRLAHIAMGDRILIHAAAGGVGLAALQIARHVGAEVFATAGSPEKRTFLRSLGVRQVMDSRSVEFAAEIQEATGGQGVHVVLNSLTGEFIPKSLSVLAAGGRFIELGQREVWSQERVAGERPGVTYASFNLLRIAQSDPELVASLWRDVQKALAEGGAMPLPRREFPIAEAVSAFRLMAQARHIGKIVLTQPEPSGAAQPPCPIRCDGSYLVTGGLGGLGLRVAAWLVERGAKHLILLARHAPEAGALETIARLQERGARVLVVRADVSREDQVREAVVGTCRDLPPLRGVIHAAGALDDGVLLQQDWSRFAKVMAAKVSGSWILHTLTRETPLDFFVLFSSAVSFLGHSGQGNHAAANAFQDALAHARRRQGLPGTSINWGAWGDVGAATRGGVAERVAAEGFAALRPEEGLRALERVLTAKPAQVAIMDVSWPRLLAGSPAGREQRLLAEMAREAPTRKDASPAPRPAERSFLEEFEKAVPTRRSALLVQLVAKQAAKVLALDAARPLDLRQPLHELGLDSLMAVELRNALAKALGCPLPATLLFDYPTLEALASYLGGVLAPDNRAVVLPAQHDVENASSVTEIARLSEGDAEALLLQELKATKKKD
jgi:acyl transferase domain-containing protein/NADPH:quinone reductase-like Zn-dependent oxidoreductase/NAD(P)-dependent dehydrogenase (short-subunit alcohol dehydrogenase family)/acyl carrier protein